MNNHSTSVQGLAKAICPVINVLRRYLTYDIIFVDFRHGMTSQSVYMTPTQ